MPDPRFPTTHWTLFEGSADEATRRARWDHVYRAYGKPLYVFSRMNRGTSDSQAKDLVQGFFLAFWERDMLAKADRDRGKFRTWLIACFKNYCADVYDHEHADKRDPGSDKRVSLDANWDGDSSVQQYAARGLTPAQALEQEQTREIFARATADLRARLEAAGERGKLVVFEAWLTADNPARPGYAALALASGLSESGVRHALEDLRLLYRGAVFDLVRPECASDDEAWREVDQMIEILGRR